ncbi:hypothetical protein AB0F88_40395 [Streptosporangium sp. NPDC023963]|uniref:hypothetical protein n=1 Tax=Streptosporangium sp. NPDC023963 TaxID=3155608 RepID=UPI003436D23B
MSAAAEVTALDLLAQKFTGWTIWRSDTGRWWATRHAPITKAQDNVGCARTVDADTPADLSKLLVDQNERAARAAS